MNRRNFCTWLGGTAMMALVDYDGLAQSTPAAPSVPYSAGTDSPKFRAPLNACDAHHHIYDTRFPVAPHWKSGMPQDATVASYRLLQKRLGTTRSIVVQPSTFGVDNSCLLDALSQLGSSSRGVVVVDTGVSDAELKKMAAAGVCGIRVNFVSPQSWGPTTPEMLVELSKRVHDLNWHVQVLMLGEQIAQMESVLQQLPTPVVLDHLGRIPQPEGLDHAGYAAVRRLLDNGRTWMKLSEAYEDTKVGPPRYEDTSKLAKSYIDAAPERVVWGSDWPHPTQKIKPDDALLFDLLADWAPNEATRRRILVSNPETLYGFPKSS